MTFLHDTFVRDHLPPRDQWPRFLLAGRRRARLNAASELLDGAVRKFGGDRIAFHTSSGSWTYGQVLERANRIAAVLVDDLKLVPGNRVLLRAPNCPEVVACLFAVLKAGGVVVPTMPLLKAAELAPLLDQAKIQFALCDERLSDELITASDQARIDTRICTFGAGPRSRHQELDTLADRKPASFRNFDTGADDPALILFTSGTTGAPKAAVHGHQDLLAVTECFPKWVLKPTGCDVFVGSPPIAFAYGLGGQVLFPLRFGASTVLLEDGRPGRVSEAIRQHSASILFGTPTGYRKMLADDFHRDLKSLRLCVSAGESLSSATYHQWHEATGLGIVDGIGTTELLHIFISAPPGQVRPGATGRTVPGYQACVLDSQGHMPPPGEEGRLAVCGPTGCRYLADPRQAEYVQNGWNLTGDIVAVDHDGYFWYRGRVDDIVVTSGYKVAAPAVEHLLLQHDAVQQCAVVGQADPVRGQILKAFIVVAPRWVASAELGQKLQHFVKSRLAPFKYPRIVRFVAELPVTATGKIQRFKLQSMDESHCFEHSSEVSKP